MGFVAPNRHESELSHQWVRWVPIVEVQVVLWANLGLLATLIRAHLEPKEVERPTSASVSLGQLLLVLLCLCVRCFNF